MKIYKKNVLIISTTLLILLSGCYTDVPSVEYTKVVISEDFTSSQIDSSLWETANWTNGNMFYCGWKSDHISYNEDNSGFMKITLDNTPFKQGSKSLPYTSGEFRSVNTYGFGKYEVKMKPCKYEGVNSSFFLYTRNDYTNTEWNEIDIEFLGKDTTKVQFNFYVDNNGEGHEYLYDLGFDASEDFHTYGFVYKKNGIQWYIDGKMVYSIKGCNNANHHHSLNSLPSSKMQIMANFWPGINVDEWMGKFTYSRPLYAEYDFITYKTEE